MKRWLGLVFAWAGVVCLLLSLPHQASLIHDPHAGGDRSVGRWRESVAASSRALLATSAEFIRSRADPFESLAANYYALWIVHNVGPPWLDYRGPPAAGGRPWVSCKAAGRTGSTSNGQSTFPQRNFQPPWDQTENLGFATGFS
jgi:hypothetical protein